MFNRITSQKNKCNRNRNIIYPVIPDEIISVIENSRFRYKEALYNILGFLLYREAYGYSMRVSQKAIAKRFGLQRSYVSEIISKLAQMNLIIVTYYSHKEGDRMISDVSGYRINPALRDPSPEFQSKLCYLYPFLAKVAFSFFCFFNALRKRLSKGVKIIKSTRYIKRRRLSILNYNDAPKISQKGSQNGVENPTHGKDPSLITHFLSKLGFPPKV